MSFEDAVSAHERGDYATALREFRVLAKQGFASAQLNLGFMYDNGEGVLQDYAEAVKWYRLAAEQGIAQAQTNLGVMHFTGRGLPQDYEEAVKWWLKAAAQGHAQAQGALRAWPRPRTTSPSCTPTASACRKTMPRR